ncbi:DUF4328 domain-containing protein [Actinophytocola sediminis]
MASPEPARTLPLLGPTAASSTLVAASCLAAVLDAWATWNHRDVATAYDAGMPGIGVADLTSADSTERTVDALFVITMIATAVALLVWLSRLRANARLRGRVGHRAPRALAVGCWLALTLFATATTLLSGANATAAELTTLAWVNSVGAGALWVAGVPLVLVVRQTMHRISLETDRPGQAMRE